MSVDWVKVVYGVVLGAVLALAVGFGTATFVSGPRPPQPPGLTFTMLSGQSTDAETTRIAKQIDGFYDDANHFRELYPNYQRDIFLVFAGIGILLAVIGVALPSVVNYLRFGFLFGGLLLVASGAWFATQAVPQGTPTASNILSLLSFGTPKVLDTAGRFLRFAVSLVGVLLLLFVGLWRLTDWGAPGAAKAAQAPAFPNQAGTMPAAVVTPASVAPVPAAPDAMKWARPEERTAVSESSPPVYPAEAPVAPAVPERPQGSQ
jgi:hypothetical protein